GVIAESRATVILGLNSVHSLAWSFTAIRTGTGLRHWNRVDGSKYAHCLQQCREAWHFGHSAGKSPLAGNVVEQLKQRVAVTGCTSRGSRGPVTSIGGRGPWGRGRSSRRASLF